MDKYFVYVRNVFDKKLYSLVETFYKDFDRIINTYYFSGYDVHRYLVSDNVFKVYVEKDDKKKLIGMVLVTCEDESLQKGGEVE